MAGLLAPLTLARLSGRLLRGCLTLLLATCHRIASRYWMITSAAPLTAIALDTLALALCTLLLVLCLEVCSVERIGERHYLVEDPVDLADELEVTARETQLNVALEASCCQDMRSDDHHGVVNDHILGVNAAALTFAGSQSHTQRTTHTSTSLVPPCARPSPRKHVQAHARLDIEGAGWRLVLRLW